MTSPLSLCLIVGALVSAVAGALFFAFAVRSGQMDDLEDVKYRMLREDDKP
jgi:cbb3-type cytochrome oxidase maturation protein